jgi:hypothetical protein
MQKDLNAQEFENISQLQGLYEVAADTSVSVIIEGEHGIGKSQSVYELAKRNDWHVEPLFLSHQEVADLIGIPTMETDENGQAITTWSKPIWLHRLEEATKQGKRTILFLDELNRAQTEVRQAALQLVLDKQIHEHKLPKAKIGDKEYDTFIVAAINPADGFYQVDEMDPALMDRFLHYRLNSNADQWLEWARIEKIHPVIIKFISNNKDKLYAKDENANIYPTPRSWAKLSELLFSYENKNMENESILYNLICGKIGYTVGAQFMTYYKENSKIIEVKDIEDIVKKEYPKSAKKYGEGTVKAVDNVAKKIKKEIDELEIPLLKELTKNLVNKYLTEEATFESAKPLICYLHALPIEQLTSTIKEIQMKSEENDDNKYDILAMISPEKEIFRRIVSRIKALQH